MLDELLTITECNDDVDTDEERGDGDEDEEEDGQLQQAQLGHHSQVLLGLHRGADFVVDGGGGVDHGIIQGVEPLPAHKHKLDTVHMVIQLCWGSNE